MKAAANLQKLLEAPGGLFRFWTQDRKILTENFS